MATYIVLASALAVIQFWVIPFLINVKNLNWQMSNRDESLDDSVLLKRARRAGANILETLPIYLVFCLLSIIEAKDISEPAFYWLILRVIHGLCYLLWNCLCENTCLAWFIGVPHCNGSLIDLISGSCWGYKKKSQ